MAASLMARLRESQSKPTVQPAPEQMQQSTGQQLPRSLIGFLPQQQASQEKTAPQATARHGNLFEAALQQQEQQMPQNAAQAPQAAERPRNLVEFMLQAQALNQQPDSIPAMMKPGEYVLPPDTVQALGGPQVLDATVAQTHVPGNQQAAVPPGFEPKHFFANGGLVEDEQPQQAPAATPTPAPDAAPGGQPAASATPSPAPAQTPRAQFVADQNQKLAAANTQLAERTAQLNERYKPSPNSPTNTFPGNRMLGAASTAPNVGQPVGQEQKRSMMSIVREQQAANAGTGLANTASKGLAALAGIPTPNSQPPGAPGIAPTTAAPATTAQAAEQPTGQQVPGLSGVYKHGEGQYSDNAQGMGLPQNLGQPSAQGMQATNALAGQTSPQIPGEVLPTKPAPQAAPAAPQLRGLPGVYQHGKGQYSDNPEGMGFSTGFTGQPSAQNMQAANNLAGQEQKRSMMSVMREQQEQQQMQQPRGFAAPQIQHSGNSSTSKDELRRLRWAAESAMANAPRKKYAMQDPAVMAYQAALQGDTAARYGGQAGLEAKTNDTNAGLVREQMQQQGANQRDASRLVTEQQRLTHDQRQQAITNDLAERRLALDDRKAGTANVPSGYRASEDGRGLEAIPGGPADPRQKNKPLNETQSKSLAFGARMQQSGEQLNALAEQGVTQPGYIKRAADAVGAGVLANWTQSGEQQQVEQSQRDYVNAVLRRESGAAISNAEFDNARQQYFPQPWDKPQVIEQKRRNRLLSTQAMLAEVPNSAERLAQLEQMIGGSSTAPNLSQGAQDGQGGQQPQRRVARTGTHNGRRVVQYEDGSLSYAD